MKRKFFFIPLLSLLLANGCNKKAAKPGHAFNSRLEAVRQAGYPVTLAELNDSYAEPPPNENAAPFYLEALAKLSRVEANSPGFLAQNKSALELLHQAALRKKCRYPSDFTQGANTTLPHLAKIKKAAQLLSQNATNQAAQGHVDKAIESLLDGLRLARSIEEEPLLLSYLIEIAAENIMQTTLESILSRGPLTEGQLALAQAVFHEAEKAASPARALAGERCLGIAAFQLPPREHLQVLAQIQKPPITTDFEAYRNSSIYDADFTFYLEVMDKAVTAGTLPFPKSLEEISQSTSQMKEAKGRGYEISAMLLPALESAFERAAEGAARLRIAQTALAVERYRLSHQNGLPSTLGELTPQFLAEIPSDPFDGEPLRYQKNVSAGYVIYSIGKDRADDGGVPKSVDSRKDFGSDVTFVVNR